MHTSGWFKNPDYERCYHLSLSFWDLERHKHEPFDNKLARIWVNLFYGDWVKYIWEEGPSDESRERGMGEVRHYRVMCDPAWQPIIPRKEVYSRDFIEKGWLSWSDRIYQGG
jgi:hypothetical protein